MQQYTPGSEAAAAITRPKHKWLRGSGKMDGCTLWKRRGSSGPTGGGQPDLPTAAAPRPQPGAGAEHPRAAASASAGRKKATAEQRIAERCTRFTGSMRFIYLHLALFGFWLLANLGWIPGVPAWDPSFVVLAVIASVEAIFLSTFVLISQNRMAAAADKRADLDLQISLLAELRSPGSSRWCRVSLTGWGSKPRRMESWRRSPRTSLEAMLDELEAAEPEAERALTYSKECATMTMGEDDRIEGDVNERLSTELPDDAAQIQSALHVAKSRWPAPSILLKLGTGPKASPRALRAWSPS